MTNKFKTGIAAAIFSVSVLGAGAAATSSAHAQATMVPMSPQGQRYMRGERGSNYNIHRVRMRLERVIDQLQHDQHDYGGHRVDALNLLQQARAQLLQAEQFEASHPGQ